MGADDRERDQWSGRRRLCLLFFADIMNDGTVSTHDNLPAGLMHKNNAPVFLPGGKVYELINKEGYRQFWAIYHRPPKEEYRDYLPERRDSLTNKVPVGLLMAIAQGKKILVLINPPYAEATNADTPSGGENKTGVSKTRFAETAMNDFGKASNELYTQFVARIAKEIPTATLAMFSTLKYVVAPTIEVFRHAWSVLFSGGFVVHNKAFEGLNGDFPPVSFKPFETAYKTLTEKLQPMVFELGFLNNKWFCRI
jgi:hypothetical protein